MNSIRTPKQGTNGTSRRIAEAVDDEDWQKFRVSLKGVSTAEKLEKLQEYYHWAYSELINKYAVGPVNHRARERDEEDIDIRVDNYLKALARGGQLFSGVCLEQALNTNWDIQIKK